MKFEYLGRMKWLEAKTACESKNLRLPTLAELENAHKTGEIKKWEEDGYIYWTSEEVSKDKAYAFDMDIATPLIYNKEDLGRVRGI